MIAETWKDLQSNAEQWNLDMAKFNALKPFFDSMDKAFFAGYAEKTMGKFPLDEVTAVLGAGDLARFLLLCIVANYQALPELYRSNNWPESMFADIHRDLKIWLETLERDFGFYGLSPRIFHWEISCLKGGVKQCGRLQFNDIHFFEPRYSIYAQQDGTTTVCPACAAGNPPSPLITYRDKAINLHIPSGSPLKADDCIKSIKNICRFVADEYPDYDYRALVCYSWLLDPQFQSILPPESNIVKFQKLGYNAVWQGTDQTREIRWRLWGKDGMDCPLSRLAGDNSMQRSVIGFLQKGGTFQEGILIIPREKVQSL